MNYKESTRVTYDIYAKDFQDQTSSYLEKYILDDALRFLSLLGGPKILDIGSGPGRDSAFFKSKGYSPLCIDIAKEMIKICQERGLASCLMDIESLGFQDNSFNGAWAYTSLLHMPKLNFPKTLEEIQRILIPEGILYIGMKEGNTDQVIDDAKYPGFKRYAALYGDEELRRILNSKFEILATSKVKLSHTYLNYLCKSFPK